MNLLSSTYNAWVVLASLAITPFASYVAPGLTKRVRTADRRIDTKGGCQ